MRNSSFVQSPSRHLAVTALAFSALTVVGLVLARAQQPPGAGGPGGGRGGPVFNFDDHSGFTEIFDGKTLNGWDGTPDLWSVQDGSIVGLACPDKPAGTTFLIYKGSEPADFELKMELKLERGNSGIQYRSTQAQASPNFAPGGGRGFSGGRGPGGRGPGGGSGGFGGGPGGPGGRGPDTTPFEYCAGRVAPPPSPDAAVAGGPGRGPVGGAYQKWNVQGYQFDFGGNASGNLWEGGRFPNERGNIATAGQAVVARDGQPNQLVGTLSPAAELNALYKPNDWNQVHIIVRGYTFIHIINGRVFNITVDDNGTMHRSKGVIAIQMEGTPMRVSARNIWLKPL
jgi:hypothetical protein